MNRLNHSLSTSLSKKLHTQKADERLGMRYKQLLLNAHENQHKLKRFEKIEFEIMSAESLEQLFLVLSEDYVRLFNLDACTLLLDDTDRSLRSLMPESFLDKNNKPFLSLLNFPVDLEKLHYLPSTVTTGVYQSTKHQWLMARPDIESIAVMPLIRRGKKLGVLCSGSRDKKRFKADGACDFLQRMAFILSVCIENAINLKRLKLSSMTDTLTQIHNRRFFDKRLPEEIARHARAASAISCLFLDVDYFKSVNDTYGHGVGDNVLRQVAQRVKSVLRSQDVFARYGGEEFAVLLPDTTNDDAMLAASRIICALNEQPLIIDGLRSLNVSLSAGVSTLAINSATYDTKELGMKLLSKADQALYHAKQQGRNRAVNAGLVIPGECLAGQHKPH